MNIPSRTSLADYLAALASMICLLVGVLVGATDLREELRRHGLE